MSDAVSFLVRKVCKTKSRLRVAQGAVFHFSETLALVLEKRIPQLEALPTFFRGVKVKGIHSLR